MRIPIIAGNWKMNKTIDDGVSLASQLKEVSNKTDVEVVICVPFVALSDIKKEIEGFKIKLGAQNMHWEEEGAYTGEISPLMLKDIGVDYVIIGHSERRQYFGETNETVNKKVRSALKHDIIPIVCVGETLEEKESSLDKKVVEEQILKAFDGIEGNDIENIVIAYEPIWAIGTGKTASSEDANNMISYIREIIQEKYGVEISEEVRIQYGGSVKADNITEIMNQSDIDGALVGGASLKSDSFIDIINF